MLDRIMYKAYKAYWDMQFRLMGLTDENDEDGFTTIEIIILLAIAIIIAVIVYQFLTGGKNDGSAGFIGKIFSGIEQKLKDIGLIS